MTIYFDSMGHQPWFYLNTGQSKKSSNEIMHFKITVKCSILCDNRTKNNFKNKNIINYLIHQNEKKWWPFCQTNNWMEDFDKVSLKYIMLPWQQQSIMQLLASKNSCSHEWTLWPCEHTCKCSHTLEGFTILVLVWMHKIKKVTDQGHEQKPQYRL